LSRRKPGDRVVRAAELERADPLQVLAFEEHPGADPAVQGARSQHRRAVRDAGDPGRRVADVVHGDRCGRAHRAPLFPPADTGAELIPGERTPTPALRIERSHDPQCTNDRHSPLLASILDLWLEQISREAAK
jgi:hypothetical protein